MALPQIAPYTLTQISYPNRVQWSVDPKRAALLVHDFQNYFVDVFDRSYEDAQINQALTNVQNLLKAARKVGIPVYYTAQPPRQEAKDRALLTDFWGDGLQEDAQAEVISSLAPEAGDTVLTKWRYSAFARTPLEEELKASGRDQLIITGIYAHIGCLTTALEAFMRDIQPFFVTDALADFSLQEHEMACDYAAKRCAFVTDTATVLNEVNQLVTA